MVFPDIIFCQSEIRSSISLRGIKGNSSHGILTLSTTKAIIATRVVEGKLSVNSKELQMLDSEQANDNLRIIDGKGLKLFGGKKNDLE